MSPALSVSLIWLLALLTATAHLSDAARRPRIALIAAAAFAATLASALLLSPQPNWIGVLVSLSAFWRLIAGPWRHGAAIAGACAGLAAALQAAGGVPPWSASATGLIALVAAFALTRPAAAGRSRAREAALIAGAMATPVVGLAADVAYGWQSAAVLNRAAAPVATPATPGWAIAILALAFAAGAAWRLWARR